MMHALRFLGLGILLAAVPACAADTVLSVTGQVKQSLQLSLAEIRQMPATKVEAAFHTSKGMEQASFEGVLLSDLLAKAEVIDGPGKGAHFQRVIQVSCADGYGVAIAMGEIDPKGAEKQVIVAYARNGQPVEPAGSLRLVVPGDKHGARSAREVVKIEVK